MAVTGTLTVRDVCYSSLRRIGVTDASQDPEAALAAQAKDELNSMLKGWQLDGAFRGKRAVMSVAITSATASYALSPRPVSIDGVRLKRGSIETPLIPVDAEEYDDLPQKGSNGFPTQYFYDRQESSGTLYVWPIIATAASETLEITYQAEFEDIASLSDTIDAPSEHYDAIKLNHAARMADFHSRNGPHIDRIVFRAEEAYRKVRGAERPASYTFDIEL